MLSVKVILLYHLGSAYAIVSRRHDVADGGSDYGAITPQRISVTCKERIRIGHTKKSTAVINGDRSKLIGLSPNLVRYDKNIAKKRQ